MHGLLIGMVIRCISAQRRCTSCVNVKSSCSEMMWTDGLGPKISRKWESQTWKNGGVRFVGFKGILTVQNVPLAPGMASAGTSMNWPHIQTRCKKIC